MLLSMDVMHNLEPCIRQVTHTADLQLFCDAKREEIKAANPGAGFGETGKLLAAAWKECTPEDKAKFQQQSQVSHIF